MDKEIQSVNDNHETNFYFYKLTSIPTLSKDEELILTKKFKEKNDLYAIKKLIESNLNYIIKIARKYEGYGIMIRDLVQEGVIGFIKSVKGFDSAKNVRLISFAIYWIKSEIHEYIIKNLRIVRIANTKSQKKIFFNLKKFKKVDWLNCNDAKIVSNLLNIKKSEVEYMDLRMNRNDVSLDFKLNDREAILTNNYLVKHRYDAAFILENENWNSYLMSKLRKAIKNLDYRSRNILKERWLLKKKSTLKELAIKYNISSERIRQLENNALEKVRNLINLDSP